MSKISVFDFFRQQINKPMRFRNPEKVRKIKLGICAMDKKARAKPMQEILRRLPEDLFEVTIFGDEVILNEPIEKWPVVEGLIAFYSTNYPTEKALDYIELRKPFLINDLRTDHTVLKDRRLIYATLESAGIELPFHVFVDRDGDNVVNLEEFDEYIVINGVQVSKPFVEKPVDAEDHNIYIYYPMSAGGGSKRLFRKIGDQSSAFYPDVNEVRRQGSFIYEEFVVTQGTDVKVYTVGPDYGHAEARKSPVVDGKVKRDVSGIEVRYPVILSAAEKEMSRKITIAFKQNVCGFDILRVHGRSYVCDVNGWSFVKNSRKYYDDCAQILTEMLTNALRPHHRSRTARSASSATTVATATTLKTNSNIPIPSLRRRDGNSEHGNGDSNGALDRSPSPPPGSLTSELYDIKIDPKEDPEELRCVIAVFRHGDRTPKQKMKVAVEDVHFIEYYNTYSPNPKKELRVKAKSALIHFLETTRQVVSDIEPTAKGSNLYRRLRQITEVLGRYEISGINRKLQMKPQKWDEFINENGETVCTVKELLIILKWGGDLTPMGRLQAEQIGAQFRKSMYPDPDGGGGVLRLHSTYRHDLKIRASDEGRVMKTAAAFTKGLLDLEGQLTPILVSLVSIEEKAKQMLDHHGNDEISAETDRCKEHLNAIQVDEEMTEELIRRIAPAMQPSVCAAMMRIGNPLQGLKEMHALMQCLCTQLAVYTNDESKEELYVFETFSLMHDRWAKLHKDFFNEKKNMFDLTKVPDVYDMSRYDVLHNSALALEGLERLFALSRDFSEAIVPQEYGIDKADKRTIGSKTCQVLLEKIKYDLTQGLSDTKTDMRYNLDTSHAEDLQINSLGRSVRTRLYFTSESHLHTILNVLRYASDTNVCAFSPEGCVALEEAEELSYLTGIVFRLFVDRFDPSMYRCEILFSPGSCTNVITDKENTLAPFIILNKNLCHEKLITCLDNAIDADLEEEDEVNEDDEERHRNRLFSEQEESLLEQNKHLDVERRQSVKPRHEGHLLKASSTIDIVTEPSSQWESELGARAKSMSSS
eukprot:gene219-400_t